MGDSVKVLLCGDVNGNLKALFKRFDVVRADSTPACMCSTLCSGRTAGSGGARWLQLAAATQLA